MSCLLLTHIDSSFCRHDEKRVSLQTVKLFKEDLCSSCLLVSSTLPLIFIVLITNIRLYNPEINKNTRIISKAKTLVLQNF